MTFEPHYVVSLMLIEEEAVSQDQAVSSPSVSILEALKAPKASDLSVNIALNSTNKNFFLVE